MLLGATPHTGQPAGYQLGGGHPPSQALELLRLRFPRQHQGYHYLTASWSASGPEPPTLLRVGSLPLALLLRLPWAGEQSDPGLQWTKVF